jgi:CheY-like chemotaxis protein
MRVLLIDDDLDTQNVISMISARKGVQLAVSGTGQAGLEYLRTGSEPDVVILDIRLPDTDGYKMLNTIQQENLAPNSKFVAITAYYTPSSEIEARNKGFDAFYAKPIPTMEFISALEQLVG